MIYIDESGLGDLLGEVVICVYNSRNCMYSHRLLPLYLFQGDTYRKKLYMDRAKEAVCLCVDDVCYNTSYVVTLCPSYLFDLVEIELTRLGYRVLRDSIRGTAQNLIVDLHTNHLIDIGYCVNGIPLERKHESMLTWLLDDPMNRMHLAKTGWECFSKQKLLKALLEEYQLHRKDVTE